MGLFGLTTATKRISRAASVAQEVCCVLADAGVADLNGLDVVQDLIYTHLSGEKTFHEIIVDHPTAANWRLVMRPDDGRLRLGYWGYDPEHLDLARYLDERLAEIFKTL